MSLVIDADRVLADLKELHERHGGPDGARRLAWSRTGWPRASGSGASWTSSTASTVDRDEAGNVWAELPGDGDGFLIVGSHLDAVPSGGWLDGCLGVMAALGVLRALAQSGERPPVTVKLVDWADEEGARFGRSLLGSSAAAGTLDPDDVRDLRDAEGTRLQDALAACDVDLDGAGAASARLDGALAYLELHIEQGPVLLDSGRLASAVSGTFGDERYLITFTGQSAHAGSTPMRLRRDSLAAAATAALEIREVGIRHDGVCTVGAMKADPGVITAIAGSTEMMLDLRHLDADTLATMLEENLEACRKAPRDVRLRGRAPARVRGDADAVPPAAGGARARRGRRRGRRRRAADPVRPAARRDRDRPPGPDRDDLRPVRPAAVAHEDRGLPRGGPAGRDRGLRAHGRRGAERGRRRRARGGDGMSLDFGVVLQTDPPAPRVIDLAKRAEAYGFSYAWTFDSHLLWEEPFVIYSADPQRDPPATVGPMVTNSATRDWTVTASLFATLNEMYGNRTVCGIGRGDSAVRVINGKPVRLAELREAIGVIRGLANGEAVDYKGSSLRLAWNPHSRLEIWVAAYGPKALALTGEIGDGFILQLADPSIAEWSIAAVRRARPTPGATPTRSKICVAAPAYVTDGSEDGLAHARDQCRWFGGMVGNHVADIVARYGADGGACPGADRLHRRAARATTTTSTAARATRTRSSSPTRSSTGSASSARPRSTSPGCASSATLGVDQFAIYLQHDAKDETLARYGELVIPEVNEREAAKT